MTKPCFHTNRNAMQYRSKHRDLAEKMKANPGKWFKVGTYNNRHTATVMKSIVQTGRARASTAVYYGQPLEAKIRGESTVWARYPR